MAVMLRLILVVIFSGFYLNAFSADQSQPSTAKLTVAVAECPPFVIVEDGRYSGLAVYLWERIGSETGLEWEYVEYPLARLLETITSEDQNKLPDVEVREGQGSPQLTASGKFHEILPLS